MIFIPVLLLAGWWTLPFRQAESEDSGLAVAKERGKVQRLTRRLAAQNPRGVYLVIDTSLNLLYLKRKDRVLLKAVCSTGSGRQLVSGSRSWTFKTPKGRFHIINRVSDPVWRKPDWAFLEEGKPVPKDDRERYERNVLGDFAFGIGNGYFIHGTLYTRLLGTNVTHGCVRLGSKDLLYLSRHVSIGTPVFIF